MGTDPLGGWNLSVLETVLALQGITYRGLQTVLELFFSLGLVLIRLTSIDGNIKGLDSPSYSWLVYLNSDTIY